MTSSAQAGPGLLDTNSIARYLVKDDPAQARRAAALIEGEEQLRISIVVLAEIAFVLSKLYRIPRGDVVDALTRLLERQNVESHEIDTDLAIQALALCRPSGRVNYPDALLWAVAREANLARVWTFDERFPSDRIDVQSP